jgi:hypothetical protein
VTSEASIARDATRLDPRPTPTRPAQTRPQPVVRVPETRPPWMLGVPETRPQPILRPDPATPEPRSRGGGLLSHLSGLVLLAVLTVQAIWSLQLVWSNTAFVNEAEYLSAGHAILAHWLHGTPVPGYSGYFSGAPVLYPPAGRDRAAVEPDRQAVRGPGRRVRRGPVRRARPDPAPGRVRDLRCDGPAAAGRGGLVRGVGPGP